jgi:hypothetical protein
MSPSAISDLALQPPVDLILNTKSGIQNEQHVHGMEDVEPLKAISHGDVTLPGTFYLRRVT